MAYLPIQDTGRYASQTRFYCQPTQKLMTPYLEGVLFDGTNLDEANLVGSDMDGASFVKASLQFAKLQGLDLCGANLKEARLAKANLCGSNLKGALNLTAAQISSTYYDEKTIMPDEIKRELVAIWKQENEGLPEQLKDYSQAVVLGISIAPSATPASPNLP